MAKNEFDDTRRYFDKWPQGNLVDAAKYVYEEATIFTVNYIVLNVAVIMPFEKALIKRLEEEKKQFNLKRVA